MIALNIWRSQLAKLIVLLFLAAASLFAQGRSSILGTITDESGAAVAKATVTILNTGTQQKWTVSSGENGLFEVPALGSDHQIRKRP